MSAPQVVRVHGQRFEHRVQPVPGRWELCRTEVPAGACCCGSYVLRWQGVPT